jgi:hypothetical protein
VVQTAAEAFIKSARHSGAVGADHRFLRDSQPSGPTLSDVSGGQGKDPAPAPPQDAVQQTLNVPGNFILHQFQLRKDLKLAVPLPPDLTQADVARLNRWMKTLPLEEDPVDSAGSVK